jgi:hypothetical protein
MVHDAQTVRALSPDAPSPHPRRISAPAAARLARFREPRRDDDAAEPPPRFSRPAPRHRSRRGDKHRESTGNRCRTAEGAQAETPCRRAAVHRVDSAPQSASAGCEHLRPTCPAAPRPPPTARRARGFKKASRNAAQPSRPVRRVYPASSIALATPAVCGPAAGRPPIVAQPAPPRACTSERTCTDGHGHHGQDKDTGGKNAPCPCRSVLRPHLRRGFGCIPLPRSPRRGRNAAEPGVSPGCVPRSTHEEAHNLFKRLVWVAAAPWRPVYFRFHPPRRPNAAPKRPPKRPRTGQTGAPHWNLRPRYTSPSGDLRLTIRDGREWRIRGRRRGDLLKPAVLVREAGFFIVLGDGRV